MAKHKKKTKIFNHDYFFDCALDMYRYISIWLYISLWLYIKKVNSAKYIFLKLHSPSNMPTQLTLHSSNQTFTFLIHNCREVHMNGDAFIIHLPRINSLCKLFCPAESLAEFFYLWNVFHNAYVVTKTHKRHTGRLGWYTLRRLVHYV